MPRKVRDAELTSSLLPISLLIPSVPFFKSAVPSSIPPHTISSKYHDLLQVISVLDLITGIMKKQILVTLLILLGISVEAAKFRVNNQLTASGSLYISFSTAHAAASAGDTIYMEGSPVGYGSIDISKKLVVIGPGYFFGTNPKTFPTGLESYVSTIAFLAGSSGSVMMGMYTGTISIFDNNIVLMRNFVSASNYVAIGFSGGSLTNMTFIQNMFSLPTSMSVLGCGGGTITNLIFQNNIVLHSGAPGAGDFASAPPSGIISALIEYNTIRISNFTALGAGTTIRNNIVDILGSGSPPTASVLSNNYTSKASWIGGCSACSTSVNMAPTTFFIPSAGASTDGAFQLATGTSAKVASTTFGEIGAFGGIAPYVLSGQPTVPSIYELTMPGLATSSSGLNITVKAKRNP